MDVGLQVSHGARRAPAQLRDFFFYYERLHPGSGVGGICLDPMAWAELVAAFTGSLRPTGALHRYKLN